jgi:hypothetical protein
LENEFKTKWKKWDKSRINEKENIVKRQNKKKKRGKRTEGKKKEKKRWKKE